MSEKEVVVEKKVSNKRRNVSVVILLLTLGIGYFLYFVPIYTLPNGKWTLTKPQIVLIQTAPGNVQAVSVQPRQIIVVPKKPVVVIPQKTVYEIVSGTYVKHIKDANGKNAAIVSVTLTKDKKYDLYLSFNNKHYRGIYVVAPNGSIIVNIDGTTTPTTYVFTGTSLVCQKGNIFEKEKVK